MEESSERRRERLRALREEASLASNEENRGGSCNATSSDPAGLPFPEDLQQPVPVSPSPRFEFYTDPLAAFSGSQKKKPKNSFGSPFSGAPTPPAGKSPASPFWQPDFNPNLCAPGNLNAPGLPNSYPHLPPPGSFSSPGPPNPNPNPNPHHFSTGKSHSGSFNTPTTNPNKSGYPSPHQSSIPGKFIPAGTWGTPRSAEFNQNMTQQGGFNNPGSTTYRPRSGFGSPKPFSAPQAFNGGGRGGVSMNTPPLNEYNQGCSGFSTDSPSQHHVGALNDMQNSGWSQNSMYSGRSPGSNRSWGNFTQSPGSAGRDNRTPGRSGGRGFQRARNDASAITNSELFAKRSMLLDPWKDLVPVRFESVASRLNACSVTGSHDWLPKSVSKGIVSSTTKGVTVSASGPSLAECLAASYTDAVLEEDRA